MVEGEQLVDAEEEFYREHLANLLGDSMPTLLEDLGYALGYERLESSQDANRRIQLHPPMNWTWDRLDPKLVSDAVRKVKRILLENNGALLMSIKRKLIEHYSRGAKESGQTIQELRTKGITCEMDRNKTQDSSMVEDSLWTSDENAYIFAGDGEDPGQGTIRNHKHQTLYSDVHHERVGHSRKPMKFSSFSSLADYVGSKVFPVEFQDCVGFFHEMSLDAFCSWSLQTLIKSAAQTEIELICSEVVPYISDVAFHKSGTHVIQGLICCGDANIKKDFVHILKNNMMCLSTDKYGHQVAQVLIQHSDLEDRIQLVSELCEELDECTKCKHASHVLQTCIEHIPSYGIQRILQFFVESAISLAMSCSGSRVIQKILECNTHNQAKSDIIERLLTRALDLSRHYNGNYVIQSVVAHGTPEESAAIIKQIVQNIVSLSCHKFGSIVVERCLTEGSPQSRVLLIQTSLEGPRFSSNIRVLARDRFGNYVAQKIIEVATPSQRSKILALLDSRKDLSGKPYRKRVASILDQLEHYATSD